MISQRTLVFLLNDQSKTVLLGLKKRGFGSGKFVGIGGKVEFGEAIEIAAHREVFEEVGVAVDQSALVKRGIINFKFPTKPSWDQDVHLFATSSWTGSPVESDEIKPSWFAFDDVPYQGMWDDARHWLPKFLKNEFVKVKITFADDLETVQSVDWVP